MIFASLLQNVFISTTIGEDNRELDEVSPNDYNKLQQFEIKEAIKEMFTMD